MAVSLQSIRRNSVMRPPRILLYSPHGIGKTSFGSQAPRPIFIQTEDGEGTIDLEAFPLAKSFNDIMDAIRVLRYEKHDYKTVVIDTLDWAERLIWADIESKFDSKETSYGKGAVISVTDYWSKLLDELDALRAKGMASILLAHAEIKRFDSPETDPYDRYRPKLQERASAVLQEWCDVVMFANLRSFTVKTDVGFDKKVSRGKTGGEVVFYTREGPARVAKNRYNLPEEILYPKGAGWASFAHALSTSAPKIPQQSIAPEQEKIVKELAKPDSESAANANVDQSTQPNAEKSANPLEA